MFTFIDNLLGATRPAIKLQNRKQPPRHRGLSIETLENRQLMTVGLSGLGAVNMVPTVTSTAALIGSSVAGTGVNTTAVVTNPAVVGTLIGPPIVINVVPPAPGTGASGSAVSAVSNASATAITSIGGPSVSQPINLQPIVTVPGVPAPTPTMTPGTAIGDRIQSPITSADLSRGGWILDATRNGLTIDQYYNALPDATNVLGRAVGPEQTLPRSAGGSYRMFERGVIFSLPTTGPFDIHSTTFDTWQQSGGVNGSLGIPQARPAHTSDNLAQLATFEQGCIVTRNGLGAFTIRGELSARWVNDGMTSSLEGLLRSSEVSTPTGVGRMNRFDNGAIVYTAERGAITVAGGIFKLWNAAPTSYGLPATVRTTWPDGLAIQRFTNNTTIYERTDGQKFVLTGATHTLYQQMGAETGALGKPLGGEQSFGNSGGFVTRFEHGAIYRNGSLANEVHGEIYNEYLRRGAEGGSLGVPTSNEMDAPQGYRLSYFTGGRVYWSASTGALVVEGRNNQEWQNLKGADGWLGMPTGNATAQTQFVPFQGLVTYTMQAFQGGTMRNTPSMPLSYDFNFGQMKFAILHCNTHTGMQFSLNPGGFFTADDWTQLRHLIATSNTMPEHVRYLASKVINDCPENLTFLNMPLGNLSMSDSGFKVQQLVNKWFGGADHPTAVDQYGNVLNYQTVAGVLFAKGGPQLMDVDQGGLGDCYFMSSLGSVALTDPQAIRNMFIDNGDGTFTVRFFTPTEVEYVTVDRMVPVNALGNLVFAGDSRPAVLSTAAAVNAPLWAILAEKAYAQVNAGANIRQDGTNSYQGIVTGSAANALFHITGRKPTANIFATPISQASGSIISRVPVVGNFVADKIGGTFGVPVDWVVGNILEPVDPGVLNVGLNAVNRMGDLLGCQMKFSALSDLKSAVLNAKVPTGIVLATQSRAKDDMPSHIVNAHEYVVIGGNSERVTLFNPQKGNAKEATIDMTWSDIGQYFAFWTQP